MSEPLMSEPLMSEPLMSKPLTEPLTEPLSEPLSPSAPSEPATSSQPEEPPTYVKLAMRNMVRKGGKSLYHFALSAIGLLGLFIGLAYITR
jgi:Protein of unknown function (DUF3285)